MDPSTPEQAASPSPQDEQVTLEPQEALANSLEGAFPEEEPQAQPAQEPEPQMGQPEAKPEWSQAPTNWPQEERERFAVLPDDQKQFIHSTVTSAHRAAQMKMDHAAEIRQTVAQFVDTFNQNNTAPPVEPPKDDTPPEDDPIGQLKWELKNEIRQELTEKEQVQKAKAVALQRQQTIEKIQTDPLAQEVRSMLDQKVASEPNTPMPGDAQGRTYQQVMYDQLNSDPVYFQQTYLSARDMLLRQRGQAPPEQGGQPSQSPQVRTTHTPVLEQAGMTAPVIKPDPHVTAKKDIIQDIRKGKVNSHTLGSYLEAVVGDANFA